MKFTISDCISRINQTLNHPSISYDDVSHFFDQAIAELNTSLRVALPTVTEMRMENTFKVSEHPNLIVISDDAVNQYIPSSTVKPTDIPESGESCVKYYTGAVGTPKVEQSLYIWQGGEWKPVPELYAITKTGAMYEAVPVWGYAVWRPVSNEQTKEFSLTDYIPSDWLILFVIPYVCFKYSVRNGDSGATFVDEFTQGFQQLQTSYAVPNEVSLSTVAHLKPYRDLALEHIDDLTTKVRTRAITDDMRVNNAVKAVYGGGLFETGGWGI